MTSSRFASYARRVARIAPVLLALCLVGSALPLVACSNSGAPYGGNFGATPGGVQDIRLARELVAEGVVPPASAFVVEGMFAEHDLPIGGAPCAHTLCVRGAGGVAPDREGEPAGWVQLGLSSTIDPAQFEREPATLIAIVDVSGSMGWGSPGSPGEVSRALLDAIVDHLVEGDRFAIVTYGTTVSFPVPLGPADVDSLHGAIARLSTNGSTNLEAGLRRGIEIARTARADSPEQAVRMMLFTDEQPNVGATSPEAFGGMVASAAEDDIGITVFGMGHGLGQELFRAMSHLRGGNAFSLIDEGDVATVIDESWPWMIVPVAFDLHVSVEESEGLHVVSGYGFPAVEGTSSLTLDASSVFLSRRRGALLVRVAGDGGGAPAGAVALSLSYTEPDGTPVAQTIDVTLPSLVEASTDAFAQPSVHSTVALALLVEGMHAAATLYGTDRPAALTTMRAARDRIASDAEASSDASLATEVELANDLLALMESGAAQR